MADFTIENEEATVTVREHASEITSFKDRKTGIEYMWQGDPAYWSGRNPTLFPMVGSTWNKEIRIHDHIYHMGNHGFARHSDFTCIRHDSSQIVMRLEDSSETLEQYPFAFCMDIAYELKGRELSISYSIVNRNAEVMPFNFGLHPAFNCPIEPDKSYSDYHLEFSSPEHINGHTMHKDNVTELSLDHSLMEKTVDITGPLSHSVSLTDGVHGVTVSYAGFEWLAFWSAKNDAKFLCIEPWHSHGDFEKNEVPFEKREGTILLKSQDTWKTAYSISIQ